ncbi:MAG: hypothetical protein HY097_10415 [Nitrospinae bacterium]|nr:hypothetical protein [Nitrospinota bacterium]
MKALEIANRYEILRSCIYSRSKQLNAKLAIVGTKKSASIILNALKGTDIEIIGVYEKNEF